MCHNVSHDVCLSELSLACTHTSSFLSFFEEQVKIKDGVIYFEDETGKSKVAIPKSFRGRGNIQKSRKDNTQLELELYRSEFDSTIFPYRLFYEQKKNSMKGV